MTTHVKNEKFKIYIFSILFLFLTVLTEPIWQELAEGLLCILRQLYFSCFTYHLKV